MTLIVPVVAEKSGCLQSSCLEGPSQPKGPSGNSVKMCAHFFEMKSYFLTLFVTHTSLACHKGRTRQGNKEIIWNHTGWRLLLLLLMWENDRLYCIIHSSPGGTNSQKCFQGGLTLNSGNNLDKQLGRVIYPSPFFTSPPFPSLYSYLYIFPPLVSFSHSSKCSYPSKSTLPSAYSLLSFAACLHPSALVFRSFITVQVGDGSGSNWAFFFWECRF